MHTEDPEITRMLIALDDALKRIDAARIALDQVEQEIHEARKSHLLWAESLRSVKDTFQPRPDHLPPQITAVKLGDILH